MRLTFRRICVCSVLLAAALLTGCIKVDQALKLNGDGTGTFHVRYGMKLETIAQIESMAKSASAETGGTAPQMPFHFEEKQVRKDFHVYEQDGVTLESFKSEEETGWKFVDLHMKFQTLAGLMKTEFLADRKMSLRRDADGNYVLEQRPDSPHLPAQNANDPNTQAMMQELMRGFHAGISVEVPGDVVTSNGEVTNRTASWIFDLEKDPQAMTKAQQLSMRVVFKGDGLKLPAAGETSPPGK